MINLNVCQIPENMAWSKKCFLATVHDSMGKFNQKNAEQAQILNLLSHQWEVPIWP